MLLSIRFRFLFVRQQLSLKTIPSRWGGLFPSEKLLVYVVDVVVYPSRLSMSIVPNVIRSSSLSLGVLFPREKLLI
jgi:hypothetical protein